MDLDDVRRKRMRLFAPTSADEESTSHHSPASLPTSRSIGGTAATPIDLTSIEPAALPLSNNHSAIRRKRKAMDEPIVSGGTVDESADAATVRDFARQLPIFDCSCGSTKQEKKLHVPCQFDFLLQNVAATDNLSINDRLISIWVLLCGYDDRMKQNESSVPQTAHQSRAMPKASGTGYGEDDDYNYLATPIEPNYLNATSGSSFPGTGHTLGSSLLKSDPIPIPSKAKAHATTYYPHPTPMPYPYPSYGLQVEPAGLSLEELSGELDSNTAFDDTDWGPSFVEQTKRAKPSQEENPTDEITADVLHALTGLLQLRGPSSHLSGHQFPPVLLSMLLRSSILDKAAELLQNDAIEDITKRYKLYACLFSFVQLLNQMSPSLVHDRRVVNRLGHNLLAVSTRLPTRMSKEPYETSHSLASCMSNLRISAASVAALTEGLAKQKKSDEEDLDEEDLEDEDLDTEEPQYMQLCKRVCDLAELLDEIARTVPSEKSVEKDGSHMKADSPKNSPTVIVAPQSVIDAWHKELSVTDVEDDIIINGSSYRQQASNMGHLSIGRMGKLVMEVSRLQSSLPPGIFVRHGSSRLDVMKILIIGPKGTPYENGLWEFDLLCPADYPNEAPKMYFHTTGRGTVRVNPNLYEDGKVCLSLLGTYPGPSWEPKRSTILQILVSIQAMIFCDEPITNEPGDEGLRGDEHSAEYNRDIYPSTVRFAMLDWLQHAGMWRDVVDLHFKEHGDEILETVAKWVRECASRPGTGRAGRTLGEDSSAPIGKVSFRDALRSALDKLVSTQAQGPPPAQAGEEL